MRNAELSACCTVAYSMSAYALRCRFYALGVEGAGMALSRRHVRVVDVEVSVDVVARLPAQLAHAFTARGSFSSDGSSKQSHHMVLSTSLASSSHAWASYALMSATLAGEVGAHLSPSPGVVQFPG
jgi:hypothetical protein